MEEDEDEEEDDHFEVISDEPDTQKKSKSAPNKAPAKSKTGSKAGSSSDNEILQKANKLLESSGKIFEGKSIVIIGVLPNIPGKIAENLVKAYGGKLVKKGRISGSIAFVVLGDQAGSHKLDQIVGHSFPFSWFPLCSKHVL